MLVCCVSAVSATDMNSTDDVCDEIVIDEVTDVIEDVEIDEVDEDLVEEEANPVEDGRINGYTYNYFFHPETGELATNVDLNFTGNFYAKDFGNFKVGKDIVINAENATFHNIGFDVKVSNVIINGGTYIFNNPSDNITSVISSAFSGTVIKDATINVTAPENRSFYAIDVENIDAQILNNTIYYVDNYDNIGYYNYVVKVKGGANVKMVKNNITAILPMKTVVYDNLTGIDRDFVGGVAISSSHDLNFTDNTLDITANKRLGGYPTLDAVLIYDSHRAHVENNVITVKDPVSQIGQNSYIYGIDAFECDYLNVNNNTITMNADKSGGYIGGNGTGAAYCVQLTGPYTGVVVSNNTLITKNYGPNAAIYSQNWGGQTSVTIEDNSITVTGKGTDQMWDLLTGVELQDDHAVVTGNTITVNNLGDEFDSGYNVYGISYCQYSPREHSYIILNNTVTVNGGNYTIYIMEGYDCNITGNTLNSNYYDDDEGEEVIQSGNSTVIIVAGARNYIGPNP